MIDENPRRKTCGRMIPKFLKSPAWILIAAGGLLLARRVDSLLMPQFWAEDFAFLLDAENGGWKTLIEPRAGYLHLAPRLIALPASFLDPLIQPGIFVGLALIATLWVVKICLSARHSLPLKPLLALSVVLIPHSGEVFLNPTNLQWIMALGLLVTLFKADPVTPGQWVEDVAFMILSGLSGPFSILAAPLFLVRALKVRTRQSIVLFAICGVAAAVQAWFILHSHQEPEFKGPFSLENLVANIGFRLGFGAVFGPVVPWLSKTSVVVTGWLLILFATFAAIKGARRNYAMYAVAFMLLLVAAAAFRVRIDLWYFGSDANGDRYWYGPKLLLVWCLAMGTLNLSARWVRYACFILLACCLCGVVREYVCSPYKKHDWYEKCAQIRQHEAVTVTINPDWKASYRRTRIVIFPLSSAVAHGSPAVGAEPAGK